MVRCSFCGKNIDELPYFCRHCGEYYCSDHRLPGFHHCKHMQSQKSNPYKVEREMHTQKNRGKIFSWKFRRSKKPIRGKSHREIIKEDIFSIIAVFFVFLLVFTVPAYAVNYKEFLHPSSLPQLTPSFIPIVSCILAKPTININSLESKIHENINKERLNYGITELKYDTALADVARMHSIDMDNRIFFDHVNPDGKDPTDRALQVGYPVERVRGPIIYKGIGENIQKQGEYYGLYLWVHTWKTEDEIAYDTVKTWMNSPGHRKNILNPSYESEGIGVSVSYPDVYITEDFS